MPQYAKVEVCERVCITDSRRRAGHIQSQHDCRENEYSSKLSVPTWNDLKFDPPVPLLATARAAADCAGAALPGAALAMLYC